MPIPTIESRKLSNRVLNKSYSNNRISRKNKLTKNLELAGSTVELKNTQKSDTQKKLPRSPYGNFLEVNKIGRTNLSEQSKTISLSIESNKSNARTEKPKSKEG